MRQSKLIRKILVVMFSCLLAPTVLFADEKPIFTDPAKVNEDYAIQGEYMADTTPLGPIGAQIVALGDGSFDGMFYVGGLPGKGWELEDDLIGARGTKDGNVVRFKGDSEEGSATLQNGVISVFNREGTKIFEMKKIERTSPTLGAKAPEGAIVLFDGTSVDHFENGKLVDGQYLGATNCKSKEQFGDHKLHIEFRTPFMPKHRGQARGNSGVYVQGRYECQVLDSFGLEGLNNECGGIYSLGRPIVNMCLPPLTWQTYDIDFTAPKTDAEGKRVNGRITVRHNGVLIHKDVELKQGTPGGLPMGDGPESLFLQDHGDPVVFRNIWVEKK
ncbi:MAG: DUF1080 domain-containing protein [Pirellulaceae bacterium]|nr:DUF1080 domain-containing protein [Pirellulaceae bacterium]